MLWLRGVAIPQQRDILENFPTVEKYNNIKFDIRNSALKKTPVSIVTKSWKCFSQQTWC